MSVVVRKKLSEKLIEAPYSRGRVLGTPPASEIIGERRTPYFSEGRLGSSFSTTFPDEEISTFTATTIEIDIPTATEVHKVLNYALPGFIETVGELGSRIASLEKKLQSFKAKENESEHGLSLEQEILAKMSPDIQKEIQGKYVALSYDGKVVVSAETELGLINELERLGIDKDSVFITAQ